MSRIDSGGQVRQREPRIRDKAYLRYIALLPCVACMCRGRAYHPVEVCHVKVGFPLSGWRAFGHSEKSHDRRAVPLCARDHREGPAAQHANLGGDERAYWERLGIYPPTFCAALAEAYDGRLEGRFAVQIAARGGFPFPEGA